MRIAYSSVYKHPLPEGHRFPMMKYELLPEQLIYEGSVPESVFFVPDKISNERLALTHTAEWINKLNTGNISAKEQRKIGFPYSPGLIHREKVITQGTLDAAFHALNAGCGANIAGGTHHAYADSGEGFCLLNDMAVAANALLAENAVKQILIIDLDVHQGNGTAKIFGQKPEVFTFSMHGKNNYPLHKEKSDLDIELEDGTDDKKYLSVLDTHLIPLIEQVEPDFIFYLSGVDVLASDKLGRLGLSLPGCKERDRKVIQACHRYKIPVCVALGGGYSADLKIITEAHANTFRLLADYYL